jgi:hypothetical protein
MVTLGKQGADDNETLCGRKVTNEEVLIDGTVGPPGTAGELNLTREKCYPEGGQAFDGLCAAK